MARSTPHRSVSQLKLFRECQEEFYWLRIRGEKYIPSVAAIQGSAFHSAYAEWELSGRTIDPANLFVKTYRQMIVDESRETPLNDWKVWGRGRTIDEDITIREELGRQQIVDTARVAVEQSNEWMPLYIDGKPAVEVPFDIFIGSTRVIGSVDLVRRMSNGLNCVRDLKTGGREYGPVQLVVYAFALERQYGIHAPVGDFWYAKDLVSKSYQLKSRTKEAWLANQFYSIGAAEKSGVWVASPGPHCFNCPVSRKCREFNDN